MNVMSSQRSSSVNSAGWPLPTSPGGPYPRDRDSSFSSISKDSDFDLLGADFSLSPATASLLRSEASSTDQSISSSDDALNLNVVVSFNKGSRLFKLRYRQIHFQREAIGSIRRLQLSDVQGLQSLFLHTFPSFPMPVPHVERPLCTTTAAPYVVTFLGEQSVQTAQVAFTTQPHYSFETLEDCTAFQEALLGQQLLFIAGASRAKSKGRGEECISQNVRVIRDVRGRKTILFFANSQRDRQRKYVHIPGHAIEHVDSGKRTGAKITLRLAGETDVTTQMRNVVFEFLDANDKARFESVLG